MTEDLEARIKALEAKLTPDPEKMSTMKVSNALKIEIDRLRDFTENDKSYEFVVWRLLGDREAYLEAMKQLEKENQKLKKDVEDLVNIQNENYHAYDALVRKNEGKEKENAELKARIKELDEKVKDFEFAAESEYARMSEEDY